MNTNQIIRVFNLDPYMSKYKSFCLPSDFFEISVNFDEVSTQTAKNIEFFDPFHLPYSFYTPHVNDFIESRGKTIIQNQKRVQDLTNKRFGFHVLLYLFSDVGAILTMNLSTFT